MNIAVVGTGYVGLVTGTVFAETGNRVCCIDIDEKKIENLKKGIIPIYEPGLEELVERNAKEKRLTFSTSLPDAMKSAEIVFIAVGTPSSADGSANLDYVFNVARSIGQNLQKEFTVVVDKSTVPVGTCDRVRETIAAEAKAAGKNLRFEVVSNPEFLKEGSAIEDCMRPDRVVVGAESPEARKMMEALYRPLLRTNKPLLFMAPRSAEMVKYAANCMLASRISFMNEIANICDKVGADVNDIRLGIGSDSRIGYPFLFPGLGYGGSCFPKDVRALIHEAQQRGYAPKMLTAIEDVNNTQKSVIAEKVIAHFGGNLKGKTIALWGLSFKPQTDDMREAPSLATIEKLLAAGARVRANDPIAIENTRKIIGDKIEYCESRMDALDGADALCLITEWNEYRSMDFDDVKKRMKSPVIFDGRNQYAPAEMAELGFTYFCIGRPQ